MMVHQKRFELRLGKPALPMSSPSPAATRLIFQNWFRAEKPTRLKTAGGGPNRPIFVEAKDFLKDFEFTNVGVVVRC
jgi:hypothetical protein